MGKGIYHDSDWLLAPTAPAGLTLFHMVLITASLFLSPWFPFGASVWASYRYFPLALPMSHKEALY